MYSAVFHSSYTRSVIFIHVFYIQGDNFQQLLIFLRSRWLCRFRADCIEGDSPTRLAMVHHISPLIVNNHVPCIPRSVHAVPLCDGGSLRLDMIDWFAGWLATRNLSDSTVLMAVGVWSGWWTLIDSLKTNRRNYDWYFYVHARLPIFPHPIPLPGFLCRSN